MQLLKNTNRLALMVLAATQAELVSQTMPEKPLLATADVEDVRVALRYPLPGTPWVPQCRVDLEVIVGNSGDLAVRVKENPAAVEVCYWGGAGAPTCRPLLASETASVVVAAPSSGLSEVRAWLRWSNNSTIEEGKVKASRDAAATIDLGQRRIGGAASVYLWSDPHDAAVELRRRLSRALAVKPAPLMENLACLRAHLQRAIADPQVTIVSSVYGSYRKEVGFGTYGLENAAFHYWGSGNASISFGRFGSFAPDCEFFLDGNHRLGAASTYPFQERGALLGWPTAAANCPMQNNGKGPITFGSDIWVGRGAVFLSGVTIGHGAVIATRAVVTKDVPPYAIVAGNPARVVRQRFSPDIQARLLKVAWWDWSHERLDALLSTGLLGNNDIKAFLEAAEAINASAGESNSEEVARVVSVLEEGCALTELKI